MNDQKDWIKLCEERWLLDKAVLCPASPDTMLMIEKAWQAGFMAAACIAESIDEKAEKASGT